MTGNIDADLFEEPDDDELLSPWEQAFLASMDLWEGEPTPRQQEVLDEIEEALPRRREMWRRGEFPRYPRR